MVAMSTSTSVSATALLAVSFMACLLSAHGHGWLSVPQPRFVDGSIRNSPISTPWGQNMVCRSPAETPKLTITAGSTTPVRWDYSANHIGDCFMYLSYDGGKKFFKIAEWAKCNTMNHQTIQMRIPANLPSCDHCIMRYEWYALHVWPSIELYVDCVDVKIVGSPTGTLPSPIVSIPGHLPLTGGTAQNPLYRNEYDPSIPFFFTGPRVATWDSSTPTPTPTPTPTKSSSSTAIRRLSSSSTAAAARSSSTGSAGPSTPSSTGGAAVEPRASSTGTERTGQVVVIRQQYKISYQKFLGDQFAYRHAFINALAYGSRPRLDVTGLAIVSVDRVDNRRIRVTFHYYPPTTSDGIAAAIVAEVATAIANGRADNTTESMEVEEEVAAEVSIYEPTDPEQEAMTEEMLGQATLAGIIVGGITGLVLLCMACCYCRRYQLRQEKISKLQAVSVDSGIVPPSGTSPTFSNVRPMPPPPTTTH